GIRFVLFDSSTDDPYTGGISLYSVPFESLGANGTTAMSNEFGISAGPNQIYAVLQPAPADSDCRPYAVTTVNIANSTSFSLSSTVCLNAGVQNGLEGGSPAGGVYSGPGVTDNGNGSTFTFDPAVAGAGTHTITYALPVGAACGNNVATTTLEVVALPEVTFSSSLSTVNMADGVQSGATGGSPAGGVYSGPGVTDDGNGMTFSFDPAAAGVGTHTVTYTSTNTAGCTAAATAEITVETQALAGDICTDAIVIDSLFGGALNVPVVSGLQDNTDYNAENDPVSGYDCWVDAAPHLNNTIWYTFSGDGNKYSIRTVVCDAVNPILNNDTQFALYSGSCDELAALACNEDENFGANLFNGFLEIETVAGVEYRLMADGFVQPDYVAVGAFCLEVTRLETVAVTDIEDTPFRVYPNPTSGTVRFDGFSPDWVTVTDQLGRSLREWRNPGAEIDLDGLPAGMYLLQMGSGAETYMTRVVKD
nr:T9SS type A sorting domain-containing protein [Flavilitoribacter sp.]